MINKAPIKFIDNKEKLGIKYDWPSIMSDFKKLKTPKDCFNPITAPIESASIFVYVSKRSKGKTTNWLLIGLIMYLKYGTTTEYVRTSKDMIKPSIVEEIFNVIKTYNNGQYIKQMTGGKYNSIFYKWKKCYLCHIDEEGKRDLEDPNPFFYFLSIDSFHIIKSGFNTPKGDLIILDEFIEEYNTISDFPKFWDLFRTVQRDRLSPKVILLANTTDPNNLWFRELCISKEVKEVQPGEHRILDVNGTKIYFEYLFFQITRNVLQMVTQYFGFAKGNPRMAHLVDTEAAWTFKPVPHIVEDEDDIYLNRQLRIRANDVEMLQVDLVRKNDGRIVVYCHPCTSTYDDSIFLTLADIRENNELWGLGYGKYCKLIWQLYERNLWYFSDNETGALIESYVKNYYQLKR